jgi:hypothetical protein
MAFAGPGLGSNQTSEGEIIASCFFVRSKPYKNENSTSIISRIALQKHLAINFRKNLSVIFMKNA